nr:hypothetical protein CFP56_53734 [Quercus suber]
MCTASCLLSNAALASIDSSCSDVSASRFACRSHLLCHSVTWHALTGTALLSLLADEQPALPWKPTLWSMLDGRFPRPVMFRVPGQRGFPNALSALRSSFGLPGRILLLTAVECGDSSHFTPGGSCLFPHPSDIGHCCDSVPPGDFPLTPPDTASDCARSDCTDMYPSWMSSFPEDQWVLDPTTGQDAGQPPSAQEMSALDASSWFSVTDESVDQGLSPVLSYECQTTRNLNSMPELDVAVLPPSLDLSFVGEPWPSEYPTGPAVYYPNGYVPARTVTVSHPHLENDICPTVPQSILPGMYQPVFNPYVAQSTYPGGNMPVGSANNAAAAPHRALLPRTRMPEAVNSQQIQGSTRVIQRQTPNPRSVQPTMVTVSNMHIQPKGMPALRSGSPNSQALSPFASPDQFQGPHPGFVSGPVFDMPGQSAETNTYPAAFVDESGALLHFDGANNGLSPRAARLDHRPRHVSGKPTDKECSYVAGFPETAEASVTPSAQDQDSKGANFAGATEEGRHRSHVLYNIGPGSDGLYHCPKFIDSHIKPFRCKLEVCSKQEFSSTACLLRHEREAHGMHGHGDRPHLCWYEGCERSAAGSGFPRRYNLFDHMKRVHDYKENASEQPQSPVGVESNKKLSSRKRKAVSPHVAQPAARRVKSTVVTQQQPQQQAVSTPPPVYQGLPAQQMPNVQTPLTDSELQRRKQHDEHLRYTQLIHRRDLLTKEMDHAHSPADIARISQEFRRLSEEFAPS